MTLGEALIEAKKYRLVDLEALILFLVFEKKVHSLQDDEGCLDLYFEDRHAEKMNRLLNEYKESKDMTYKPSIYQIETNETTAYILAHNQDEAERLARTKRLIPKNTNICLFDELVKRVDNGTSAYTVEVDANQYKYIPTLIGTGG